MGQPLMKWSFPASRRACVQCIVLASQALDGQERLRQASAHAATKTYSAKAKDSTISFVFCTEQTLVTDSDYLGVALVLVDRSREAGTIVSGLWSSSIQVFYPPTFHGPAAFTPRSSSQETSMDRFQDAFVADIMIASTPLESALTASIGTTHVPVHRGTGFVLEDTNGGILGQETVYQRCVLLNGDPATARAFSGTTTGVGLTIYAKAKGTPGEYPTLRGQRLMGMSTLRGEELRLVRAALADSSRTTSSCEKIIPRAVVATPADAAHNQVFDSRFAAFPTNIVSAAVLSFRRQKPLHGPDDLTSSQLVLPMGIDLDSQTTRDVAQASGINETLFNVHPGVLFFSPSVYKDAVAEHVTVHTGGVPLGAQWHRCVSPLRGWSSVPLLDVPLAKSAGPAVSGEDVQSASAESLLTNDPVVLGEL